MVKKGKHFSGKVTPLFASMLVQPTEDEGAPSERPSEAQPTPSPIHTSEVSVEPQSDPSPIHTSEVPVEPQTDPSPRPSPATTMHDSIPESSGGNLGGHSSNDKSLSGNEDEMTIQSVYDLCLSLCKQVSDQAKEIKALKAQITKLKKQAKPVIKHHRAWLKSVSLKQRFPSKSFSKKHRVHKESVSKQRRKVAKGESSVQRDPLFDTIPKDSVDHIETENAQDEERTREMVDEDKEIDEIRLSTKDVLSTDKEVASTDKEKVSTDRPLVSTNGSKISTDGQIKGTDEHNEGTEEHIKKAEEQREGTEEKVESTNGQRKCTKDQTKEEIAAQATQTHTSISKAFQERRRKPLPKIDPKDKGKKKIKEEDESESESDGIPEAKKKFETSPPSASTLIRNYDDIKARIEADRLLAKKLQEEEREQFTIEEREKFLHDRIAAQRKFFAQQRSEAIRNRPPTKNQLRKSNDDLLKPEETSKQFLIWKPRNFEEYKLCMKRLRGKEDSDKTLEDDSEKENDELRLCLTIAPDEDKEVDYEILDKKYPIIEWKTEYLGTKPQVDKAKHLEEINQNVVIRSNGQKRYFSTLMRVLSIFDRDDLNVVYQLVMDRYQDEIPEGFDRDWNVVSWKLHGSLGVHTLMTKAGLVIHMLVEKKYPLRKKVLLQMLELKLESEEDSTMALELIRFVKKLVAELEPEDSDGDEEDL
ncbi:hypothetical protein Tco_0337038 [Tanacetum coccineum]